jgi:hypothetical protein
LPKPFAANFFRKLTQPAAAVPRMMSSRSIHAGNECLYAGLVLCSHISRMGESDAAGRLLD